jgi:hypothetical protein
VRSCIADRENANEFVGNCPCLPGGPKSSLYRECTVAPPNAADYNSPVAKYLYVLTVSKALGLFETTELQKDLRKIFQAEQITSLAGNEFRLVSPLDPGQVEADFRTLTGKYGPVEIRAGAKMD